MRLLIGIFIAFLVAVIARDLGLRLRSISTYSWGSLGRLAFCFGRWCARSPTTSRHIINREVATDFNFAKEDCH